MTFVLSWLSTDYPPAFNSVKFHGLAGLWWAIKYYVRFRRQGAKHVTLQLYRGPKVKDAKEAIAE